MRHGRILHCHVLWRGERRVIPTHLSMVRDRASCPIAILRLWNIDNAVTSGGRMSYLACIIVYASQAPMQ